MGTRDAVIAELLYAGVFWSIKFSVYSPAYVDFQTQTILWLGIFLALSRMFRVVPWLLVIAVLQKEALILLAGFTWFVYSRQHGFWNRKSAVYLCALVGPAAVALIAVRWLLPVESPTQVGALAEHSLGVLDLEFWVRFALAS
jgi:hypothetical protein